MLAEDFFEEIVLRGRDAVDANLLRHADSCDSCKARLRQTQANVDDLRLALWLIDRSAMIGTIRCLWQP